MEQYTKIDKKTNTIQNAKYGIYTVAAGIFVAAAYYLPIDTFFAFLAAGLFLVPTAIFVEMVQKMKTDDKGGI